MKETRIRTSTSFKNCLITCTIGQGEETDGKNKHTIVIFYPVIDSILLEMNNYFPTTNIETLRDISSLSRGSSTIL